MFARERRITSTGIVIYKFFKRSLHCSHQRRHSEVPCASFAALWALLCCTASNEGALNGSVNKKKMKKKKSQRLHNEISGLDVKQHAPKGYKTVQRDARMQDREQRQDRQSGKYKNGDGHAQDIPEVLAS